MNPHFAYPVLFALFFAPVAVSQHPLSLGTFTSSIDGVVAQFVDGGSWKTIISLVNLDSTPTSYTIKFYSDAGVPMIVQTNLGSGSTLTGTIPVGGARTIETPGTSFNVLQGWARVSTSNQAGGTAIFRQTISGRPDYEASMPISVYVDNKDYLLPFDHQSSTTGIALVNGTSSAITVFIELRDESGSRIVLDSFDVSSLQHLAFSLLDRYPQSAGHKGVVEISTSGLAMNVLGLRFGPEAFTSVFPLPKR